MDVNLPQNNGRLDTECPICYDNIVLPTRLPACGHVFCFLCIKGVSMHWSGSCPVCRGPIDKDIFVTPFARMDLKMSIPVLPLVTPSPGPPAKRARRDEGETSAVSDVVVKIEPEDEEDVKPDVEALRAQMFGTQNATPAVAAPERFFWLYEARSNGWWRFDPRVERDLEEAKNSGTRRLELMLCGSQYVIDFAAMVQYPKNDGMLFKRSIARVPASQFDLIHVKGIAGLHVEHL